MRETRKGAQAHARHQGEKVSGVITAIGKDVQDFEIGDEVYGTNDWSADGATAEFCITLPQNIGPVRAMELE
jgi:NADPH:quinone reductase-like Zn-dependent oxidoreductase